MRRSVNPILALAAFATLPFSSVLAQDVCSAAVVTVTVTVDPTPIESLPATLESVVPAKPSTSSPAAEYPVVSSSVVVPVSEASSVAVVSDKTTTTSCTSSFSTSTVKITDSVRISSYLSSASSVAVASSSSSSLNAYPTVSLAISDFVFATPADALAAAAAATEAAASSPSSSSSSSSEAASTSSLSYKKPIPSSNAVSRASTLGGVNKGQATFYGGNTSGGMCSFTGYTLPAGIYGTALSDSNWAGSGNCGGCIKVTGPNGNSLTAMITDQCPGCGTNHLDLYQNAFTTLADISKGVIDVSWQLVECGITSPIVLRNKEGTSQWWFSIQVLNSNVPVSKLEVSKDGGNTWTNTNRQPYNYFEYSSGFNVNSVTVRVTSSTGKTIIVNNVGTTPSAQYTASSNF